MNNIEPGRKRKAINDFFAPRRKYFNLPTTPPHEIHSAKIRCGEVQVPGLDLHQEFVTKDEERAILDFINDESLCMWRTDLNRRTMHFGGTYCLMPPKPPAAPGSKGSKPEIIRAPSMPDEFSWLVRRFAEAGIFGTSQMPQYCIINEYTGANGISAHTENFQFGEPVVGLSLLGACSIRFHELKKPFDGSARSGKAGNAEKTGRQVDVHLPERSLLVMRGQSRWRWQHEIVRSKAGRGESWKRVSLTFRYKPEKVS